MRIAAWAFVLAGAGLVLVRFFGEPAPNQGAEAALAAFAYGTAVASPGVVALVGGRSGTIVAAGVAGVVTAMFASFGATLPLVIPAVALLVAGSRRAGDTALADLAIVVLAPLAVVALWVHPDAREWTTPTTTYGTSDVVTWAEAAISLTLTAAVVALASSGTARPCRAPRAGSRGSRPASPSAT